MFVLVAFYVAHGLRVVYSTKWLRMLLAPGLLACNVSRLIACQLTFTKRTETNLWERDGVKYQRGTLSIAGDTVIATATFLLPFVLLFAVNHLLGYPLGVKGVDDQLPDLLPEVLSVRGVLDYLLDLDRLAMDAYDTIVASISHSGAGNPAPWVVLYLSIIVMLATAPTKKDLKYLLLGLLVVSVGNRLFGLVREVGVKDVKASSFEDSGASNAWHFAIFLVSVLFALFLVVILLDVIQKMREVALEPDHSTDTTQIKKKQ